MGFLVVFASSMLWVRCELIGRSLPYPLHIDEYFFSTSSLSMLQDGSLRPRLLNWPTLPIYLAAAAESFGYLAEAGYGDVPSLDELSVRVYPHYEQPGVVLPAKLLFAALSVATLVLVGLLARCVTESEWGLVLAPVVLSLNSLYLEHSWSYLNVDIASCFFVVLAITYLLLWGDARDSLAHSVLIPGVLCGLAMASKYTHGAVALPFLISLAYKDPRRLMGRGLAFFAVLGLCFAVATPYALLDWPTFVEAIARQRSFYGSGWPGHTVEAGLPHLALQLHRLIRLQGSGAFALGVLGLCWLPTRGVRRALLLAAYPVAFTLFFTSYRVDFTRNLLPVHALFAVFAAAGTVAVGRAIETGLRSLRPMAARPALARALGAAGAACLVLAPAPWRSIARAYSPPLDSRKLALAWIRENVPAGSRLVVAEEIGIALGPVVGDYEIRLHPFASSEGDRARVPEPTREAIPSEAERGAYFLVPVYGYDRRRPEREAIADGMNAFYASGQILAEFGARPVLVQDDQPVPFGNPKFSIRRGPVLADR